MAATQVPGATSLSSRSRGACSCGNASLRSAGDGLPWVWEGDGRHRDQAGTGQARQTGTARIDWHGGASATVRSGEVSETRVCEAANGRAGVRGSQTRACGRHPHVPECQRFCPESTVKRRGAYPRRLLCRDGYAARPVRMASTAGFGTARKSVSVTSVEGRKELLPALVDADVRRRLDFPIAGLQERHGLTRGVELRLEGRATARRW